MNSKRTDSLLFRFAIMFLIFTIVTLLLSGILMFISQTRSYREQCKDNIREMSKYLESMILNEKDDFLTYKHYFMEHYHEMEIPFGFDDFNGKKLEFYADFAHEYPGKALGTDIKFNELSPGLQREFAEYMQEYWLLTFEKAKADFNLEYCYFLTIEENEDDSYEVFYVLDAERTEREGSNGQLLHLGDQYHHTPEEQPVEWKVWSTGEETDEFQEWDNEWGHTYTYYIPLKINGEKLGLICSEISVDDVNRGIVMNALREMLLIAIVLIACVVIILYFINRNYIYKIVEISDDVRIYSSDKDPAIAGEIEQYGEGGDEISALANQVAAMIQELDFHMKNLIETHKELSETKERASSMQALANKDALTGIRNKTAYDQEISAIENTLKEERLEFGIAMIDLNFLKKINDTYGHEQGNTAIRKLCRLVCVTFEHSPVFRIGGDEFVVILRAHDMIHYEELEKRFNDELARMQDDNSIPAAEKVSAAIGVAFYDPNIDAGPEDVFKRADNAMYRNKRAMKAERDD